MNGNNVMSDILNGASFFTNHSIIRNSNFILKNRIEWAKCYIFFHIDKFIEFKNWNWRIEFQR